MDAEAILNNFEAYMTGNKLSEATIYTYNQCVAEFLSVIGRHPNDTTKRDIETFKTHLADRVGARSIVVALSAISNFLESHDNYECRKVKRPRVPKKEIIPLTEEEVKRLLTAAGKDPLASAVISVLYYTGMRSGSLRKLEWRDILWEEGKVNLRNAKRGKDYTVLLPPQAQEPLRTYRPYREDPLHARDNDVIFILPTTREPLGQPAVNYRVKKYAARAGITKQVNAHLLRHSHGTIARMKGLSLDTIARQFGHDDISSTMIYAQLADNLYEQEYQEFFSSERHVKPDLTNTTRKRQPDFDSAYR